MELYQRVAELGEANQEFLLRYNWQWFCSLDLRVGSDCIVAESKLKSWRIKMGIKNHMLIAYMGGFNTINNPHIHLLALGKRNKFGQTLLNLDPKDWEYEWAQLNKYKDVQNGSRLIPCTAKIEPIYEREGVANYIAKKNMPGNISESIQINNKRILKEVRSELIQPCNKRLLDKAMVG